MNQLAQHDIQALHRGRERRIISRTAVVHAMRGLLHEYGIVLPHSLAMFRAVIVDTQEADQANLTVLSTAVCWPLDAACLAGEQRLVSDDEKRAAIGQAHPACQRRQPIPGIGPVTATARLAALGDVPQVTHGRQLAAWLGLVPRGTRRALSHGCWAFIGGGGGLASPPGGPWRSRDPALERPEAGRAPSRAPSAHSPTGPELRRGAGDQQNARMVWALLAHHQASRSRTAVSAQRS
jgi:transposase IS116/IS110/IS902 family protein